MVIRKKSQGHLLKVGRRWRGRAERTGNDINHQWKEKFLRKSEHTTKAADNECIMTLGQTIMDLYLQDLATWV